MSNVDGVDSAIAKIQDRALVNELDYQFVMYCLKDFRSPRAKLTRLLKSGALIRAKKGLYLLGPRFKHSPYCLELVSNMIYGPSYVSLERALHIYGLIPEDVPLVTCMTTKASKQFKTPVGNFTYTHIPLRDFFVGVTTMQFSKYENPLIACPEKALTDLLMTRRGKMTSMLQLEAVLLEDLRIEEEDLLALDLNQIRKIKELIPHSAIQFLEKWLSHKMKKKT
jgi:hypothetical protein